MKQLNMMLVFVFLIMLAGCGGDEKSEPSAAVHFLESKGYSIIKQQDDVVRYVLNEEMLIRMPDMVQWGLLEGVDPAVYIGKTIEVERYTATGSLAIEGEAIITVFLSDGKSIGGFETVLVKSSNNDAEGMFSLDGKTLQEVSGKSFEAWQRDWLERYGK
ncbi:hypothetical protein I6N90_14715 [Paenibacillus sp. GSMTC-2017]|uniref:hypothetical protein n=1 Tax=Paenibacillus sp. GSMTC-2017 TaxID=2794350 RepID=UPI0018D9E0AB|nr:hypothetical protein [Paenibacillus sp. GSMTC-2017]MBH5319056.1 hypothetical protein [Paenibacillus sp. GSMTC-2017]